MSDLDIDRLACGLIDSRGYRGAAVHAADMVVVMLDRHDDAGERVWRQIAGAIRLRRTLAT